LLNTDAAESTSRADNTTITSGKVPARQNPAAVNFFSKLFYSPQKGFRIQHFYTTERIQGKQVGISAD